ncbi:MAG: sulfite exporter TauE/SafE family protein [Candidatus Electryoneaceae bacterium]|nr:sulfite exporter TauE/SafE family protein [Candidatus Electryoneaceae bacterium]
MHFPISGVDVFPLWLPLIAFVIAFACSTAGVTGAFLLLPFQVSVLGFTGPAVSATNHLYNVFAGPGGVIRFIRDKRFIPQLAIILICGTVPGLVIGIYVRIRFLLDPYSFKTFVGVVLLVLGVQLLFRTWFSGRNNTNEKSGVPDSFDVEVTRFDIGRLEYRFNDVQYGINVPVVWGITLVIGVISGASGIGGGSLISAILVGLYRLPVYTTAGACILTTFITSLIGVIGYTFLSSFFNKSGMATSPDWLLGLFFGVGGFIGTYFGARIQKFVPEKVIRTLLGALIMVIAGKYIWISIIRLFQ